MYELKNIFEQFLPYLLAYPYPKDPLNGEAAKLQLTKESEYNERVNYDQAKNYQVRQHVRQNASLEALRKHKEYDLFKDLIQDLEMKEQKKKIQ